MSSDLSNLCLFGKVASTVGQQELMIWENNCHHKCITSEIERINKETERLDKKSAEEEEECAKIQDEIEELERSLLLQQQGLEISEKSVTSHKQLMDSLEIEKKEWRVKYESALQQYGDLYKDFRKLYEDNSPAYKRLRKEQIELKELKVEEMQLDATLKAQREAQKQFNSIQKMMFQREIIKFAEFCVLDRKDRELDEKLKIGEQRIKELMEKKNALVEASATKNRRQGIISLKKVETKINTENKTKNKEKKMETFKRPLAQMLEEFMAKEDEIICTDISNTIESEVEKSPKKVYNTNGSKIKILMDMQLTQGFNNKNEVPVKDWNTSIKLSEKSKIAKVSVECSKSEDSKVMPPPANDNDKLPKTSILKNKEQKLSQELVSSGESKQSSQENTAKSVTFNIKSNTSHEFEPQKSQFFKKMPFGNGENTPRFLNENQFYSKPGENFPNQPLLSRIDQNCGEDSHQIDAVNLPVEISSDMDNSFKQYMSNATDTSINTASEMYYSADQNQLDTTNDRNASFLSDENIPSFATSAFNFDIPGMSPPNMNDISGENETPSQFGKAFGFGQSSTGFSGFF